MGDGSVADGLTSALSGALTADSDLAWSTLIVRMGAALGAGALVAATHRLTRAGRTGATAPAPATGLVATLVLLTVLVAMMTLVIGNNVARAFGVVGALAIVRFRTNVEDTRDTAFVIFAVAVGTAIGAGYIRVPLVGVPVAMIAALLFQSGGLLAGGSGPRRAPAAGDSSCPCELAVRIGLGQGGQEGVERALGEAHASATLQAVESARQGAALELTYRVVLNSPGAMVPLIAALNALPGVQSARLRNEEG
ncbi:MAG: DUF4956 domain-containing protein [Phycisphaerales bacterium]